MLIAVIISLLLSVSPSEYLKTVRSGDFLVRVIDTEKGLSQNNVRAIIQDENGFMWFGTRDGLNRYDGCEIRTVKLQESGQPLYSFVNVIYQTSFGEIYVGTVGGLAKYDKSRDVVTSVPLGLDGKSDATVSVYSIAEDGESRLWIPALKQGFFCIDQKTGDVKNISSSEDELLSYNPSFVTCTRDGLLLFVQDATMIMCSGNGLNTAREYNPAKKLCQELTQPIMKLIPSKDDHLIVLCPTKLFQLDQTDGSFRTVALPTTHDVTLGDNGEIYVGTDEGLFIFDRNLNQTARLKSVPAGNNSMTDEAIYSLYVDDQKGIWAGSYFCGVQYLAANVAEIAYLNPTIAGEKFGRRIHEIVPDNDGTIWIGTEDKGLIHFHPADDLFESVPLKDKTANVQGLLSDGDCLWVGTHSNTAVPLFRMDKATKQKTYYPSVGPEVASVIKVSSGDIYAGSVNGLFRYDSGSDEFEKDPQISCSVKRIVDAGQYGLVLCTPNGIYLKSAHEGDWKHFRHSSTDKGSLPSDNVLDVFLDSRGVIWIATALGGLSSYDPDTQSFRNYMDEGIFPYSTIYRIVEDKDGYLWLTTDHGIAHFDTEILKYVLYTKDSGLLSNSFNFGSLYIDDDGRVFAGTVDGLMIFNSRELRSLGSDAPISFTEMSIIHRSRGGVSYKDVKNVAYENTVHLGADENSFELGVSVMNYLTQNSRFAYKMDGYNKDWQLSNDKKLLLHQIKPGHYVLHVRGLNPDSSVNDIGRELEITVDRPVYLQWWMILLYIIVITLVVFAIRHLMKREYERRYEESRRKDAIQKELELYEARLDMFTGVAHEIKTPLALIYGPAQSLKKKLTLSGNAMDTEEDLDAILRNSTRMMTLISQILDIRKAEKKAFPVNRSEFDIVELITSIAASMSSQIKGKDFSMNVPDGPIFVGADREMMTKIITNLLFNASKYSDSRIKLDFHVSDEMERFTISVENDGRIIPEDKRESIFKPFVRLHPDIMGTGIGLSLSRTLAELQDGELVMDKDFSTNRFILTLPLVHVQTDTVSENMEQSLPVFADTETDSRQCILVVEDNSEMRSFVMKLFSSDYRVLEASDGLKAVDILENTNVDLIISDVMMPEMDGFELCEKVKTDIRFCHIPVLLITAKGDIRSKIEGAERGADIYMEKPFQIDLLNINAKTLLANRERIKTHFSQNPGKDDISGMSPYDKDLLTRINAFISENIDNPDLKVDDMAAAVFMSTSSFFRKMKSLLNMSPNEYLQRQRLTRAAAMLCEGGASVADISYSLGFSSHSYFSSCFKKQFGMTPSEYANRNHPHVD